MNKKIWAAVLSGILVMPIYCTGILKQDYNAQAAQEIQDETALPALVLEMSKESGCYPSYEQSEHKRSCYWWLWKL